MNKTKFSSFSVNPKDLAVDLADAVNGDRKRRRVDEGEPEDLSPKRIKVSASSGNLEENDLLNSFSQSNNSNGPLDDPTDDHSNSNKVIPNGNELHFDSDYMFLLSFYEFLSSVPAERKLNVRALISRAISTIVENDYNRQQENDSNLSKSC